MGRALEEEKTIDGVTFSLSHAYNQGGLETSTTLPNGTVLSRTYDRMARLTMLESDWSDANHPGVLARNFDYASIGALASVEYGNGTISTRTYNSGGQLKTLQHGTSSD